ncbi:sulfotransferase family 2 domain-containing protein [Rhodobacter ferrooxidans]|uniref:sulfotransferase family 2 domain-containing protein n=1 Tax=Rhodobacter ferrooxidans TaxID=371731 RepID=UPI0002EE63BB|nr:sulfotransferase family 2 domain-containing protein [Rhodobacter sp. SW2]
MNLIRFEPAKILYVLTPKCGSSSMVNIFLTMAGFDPREHGIRKLARSASTESTLAAQGLFFSNTDTAGVLRSHAEFPEHKLLANIRNPADRVLSNYYNKLNRYTKQYAFGIYAYGKLRQFMEGPKSWRRVARGNAYMQRHLSFQALLDGLEQHGPGFDAHYALQSELLALDKLHYAHLFRLENLDADFRDAMAGFGLPSQMLDRVKAVPRNNPSAYGGRADALMTPQARASIARIYAADFAALGYPV